MNHQFCCACGLLFVLIVNKTALKCRVEVNEAMGNSLAYFMLNLRNPKKQRDLSKRGKIPSRREGNHALTKTPYAFCLRKIFRLFPNLGPWP